MVLNGVRLHYRVAGPTGSGAAPVLYLHGGPGYDSYSFAALAGRRLEGTLPMIYLDQRGCGRSERPWTGAYALDTLVEDIEALRRSLAVPRLSLLGHSFGGTLALEYAAKYPEHVARLVIVDGLSDGPATYHVWREQLARLKPEAAARSGAAGGADLEVVMRVAGDVGGKEFFDRLQFHDSTFRVLQDSVDSTSGLRNTGELSAALFSHELPGYRFTRFERLTMPALVIGGRYDYSIGIGTLQRLAERLPHGRFLEYERSGHFPYLEEADRFDRDVTEFLAGR